jgi:hypothetical protein
MFQWFYNKSICDAATRFTPHNPHSMEVCYALKKRSIPMQRNGVELLQKEQLHQKKLEKREGIPEEL